MHAISAPPTNHVSAPPARIRFATLTEIELRKATDTRSGRWLLASSLALAAAVLVWKVSHPTIAVSFDNYAGAAVLAASFIVPVIGLLAMTSEWTERTALSTFTLTPRRITVLAAKYVASVMLSLAVLATTIVLSLVATAIGVGLHGPASYAGMTTDIRGYAIVVVLQVTMAAAFGVLAAQTSVALVAFLVAPTAWAAAANGVLAPVASWFDVFAAHRRLSSERPFDYLAWSATAVTVWVIVPSVIGVLRGVHRDVK